MQIGLQSICAYRRRCNFRFGLLYGISCNTFESNAPASMTGYSLLPVSFLRDAAGLISFLLIGSMILDLQALREYWLPCFGLLRCLSTPQDSFRRSQSPPSRQLRLLSNWMGHVSRFRASISRVPRLATSSELTDQQVLRHTDGYLPKEEP